MSPEQSRSDTPEPEVPPPYEVRPGEKFGLLLANLEPSDGTREYVQLAAGTWFCPTSPFALDDDWAKWLGSIVADEMRAANFCLLHKFASGRAGVVDSENRVASDFVQLLFQCVLLHGIPWRHTDVRVLTGANTGSGPEPRQHYAAGTYRFLDKVLPAHVTAATLLSAMGIRDSLDSVYAKGAGFARFRWGYHSLVLGLQEDIWEFRLHNYVRAIEALVKPREGRTTKDFVHRGQTLCVACDVAAEELERIYEARCVVEHLHDWHVEEDASVLPPHKNRRLIVRRAERIALDSYLHVLSNPALLGIYRDDASIDQFWMKQDDEKRAIWGGAVDVRLIAWGTDQYGIEQLS